MKLYSICCLNFPTLVTQNTYLQQRLPPSAQSHSCCKRPLWSTCHCLISANKSILICCRVAERHEKPQTLLFTATLPPWVDRTAKKYMSRDRQIIDLIGQDQLKASETVQVRSQQGGDLQRIEIRRDSWKVESDVIWSQSEKTHSVIDHYQNEWELGSESATQRHLGSFGGAVQAIIPNRNVAPLQLWLFVQPGTQQLYCRGIFACLIDWLNPVHPNDPERHCGSESHPATRSFW